MRRMQSSPVGVASATVRTTVRRTAGPAILLALALAFAAAGCGDKVELPGDRKLVVIGFDAADWGLMDPLLAAGRMPAMSRFRAESASGTNMSFVPLQESPVIWTSMATGRAPGNHGIGGFVDKSGEASFTTQTWRAPAFWDVAGATGRTVCVVGWWITYPARAVNGVMVGDAYSFTRAGFRDAAGLVRPAALRDELAALEVDWRDVTPGELGRFVHREALVGHEAELASLLDELRIIVAGDRSTLAMAKHLAARSDFDVFTVYFRGLDVACHKFWDYHRPEMANRAPSDVAVAVFRDVVPDYYVYCDELLGELLALFPADRSMVILSDHGFKGKDRRDDMWVGGVQAHRPQGVIAMRSPIHEAGARTGETPILDVGPTLLALLGLPPSREMPGEVIRKGLTPAGLRYVDQLERNRVESYQAFAPAYDDSAAVAPDPEMDEAVKRQLRSLGYID